MTAVAQQLLAITGAAGRIGTALRPLLRGRYRLRLADIVGPSELEAGEESTIADIRHLPAAESVAAAADCILHLAGNASTAASWDEVRGANIEGTYNVFEAARRQGVRKVVFASTNHVMGFANLEQSWPIPTDQPIRPDSLYGVSKAFGEALARYYSDCFEMSIICLRIGWFTPHRPDRVALNPLWISARDLAQLVERCLDTPRQFGIYNGTSNNPQRHWDLKKARDELGFDPLDDVTTVATDAADGNYVDPRAGVLRAAPSGH